MLSDKRYRKPPLIEVFCDFYFELDENDEWDPKRLAQFTDEIRSLGYPADEDVRRRGFSIPRGPRVRRRKRRESNWQWRHRFVSADGERTAQVGENLLVINQFPPYYGWNVFREQALACFDLYQRTWPSAKIAHAGLHYVDVVEIPGEAFFIDDYFNMFPVIPNTNQSINNIAMAYEVQAERPGDACSIAFHQRPSAAPEVNTFRFRWDYVCMEGLSIEIGSVEEWLDVAHDFVDKAFRSTFTEQCEQLFDPET